MQTVNRSMVNIVGALERSLAGNNLEKMAEVSFSCVKPAISAQDGTPAEVR